jgi:hypothetical protein
MKSQLTRVPARASAGMEVSTAANSIAPKATSIATTASLFISISFGLVGGFDHSLRLYLLVYKFRK